jgi:hypothetical protein
MASSHKNAEAPRSARSVAREPNKPEELTSSESKTATVARGLDKHGVVSEQKWPQDAATHRAPLNQ